MFSRLDTVHQRDRQTDRQTDTGRQQRPRLHLASRGKKWRRKELRSRTPAATLSTAPPGPHVYESGTEDDEIDDDGDDDDDDSDDDGDGDDDDDDDDDEDDDDDDDDENNYTDWTHKSQFCLYCRSGVSTTW